MWTADWLLWSVRSLCISRCILHTEWIIWYSSLGIAIHDIIIRYGESIWPGTSPRQTELNVGNLEPDLLARKGGWVAKRPSCRSDTVKWIGRSVPVFPIIYLPGFHTRCLYWVSRRPSPGSNYSTSPPMKLMTSQSLPPSSASSVMIMSHRIDLAGLAHRENSLTLHCFLTWNSIQSDKISPPTPLVFTQNKEATHPRIGLGLGSLPTPSKTPSPLFFFRLHWLEHSHPKT